MTHVHDFTKSEIAMVTLYMFAGWLTTRNGTLKSGAQHDAVPMVDAVKQFCSDNGIPEVELTPEHWARWRDAMRQGANLNDAGSP